MYNNDIYAKASTCRSGSKATCKCGCNGHISESYGMPTSTNEANDVQNGCGDNIVSAYGLVGFPLASVYSPLQNFVDLYDIETGLSRGTIFRQLDLPFVCGGMNGGVSRG